MGSQLKDGLGQPDDLAIGYNSAMMNPVFRRRRRRILLAAACLILLLPLLLSASGALSPMRGMQQENRQVALTFDDLPVNSTRMELENMQQITANLLDSLKRRRIPAIGFVNEGKLAGP